MKFWPFNRNRTTVTEEVDGSVPEEVKEYYQSSRRDNVGVAWLLSIATLLITIVLAVGLFFGGRWLFRKISGPNDRPTPAATQNPAPAPSTSPNSLQTPGATTPQNTTPSTPTPGTTSLPGNGSSTSPSGRGSTSVPNTGPAPTTIPNTGPSSEYDY